jgi:PAS domain S-box-containing protein
MYFDEKLHENHSALLILGAVLLVAFVFFRNYKEHSKAFKVGAYIIILSLFIQFMIDITSLHEILFEHHFIHIMVHVGFGVTYFFFALGVYRESYQYKKMESISKLTLNFDEVIVFEHNQTKKTISISISNSIKNRYNLENISMIVSFDEFKSWIIDSEERIIKYFEGELKVNDKDNVVFHLLLNNQGPAIAVQIKGSYLVGNRIFCLGFDYSQIESLSNQKDKELYHKLNLIQEMQLGFAEHEMIYDNNGNAIDYRYLYVNEIFCELTGWKKEEIEGKLVSEVYPNVDESRIERYQYIFDTNQSIVYNSYFEKQNAWYELKAYKSDKNKFVTLFLDITQIKEINRNLEYLNTHNPLTKHWNYEGLLRLDEHYKIKERAICFFATIADFEEYKSFYGHEIADLIIKRIGHEFDRYLIKSNIVCHTLENQFILIMMDPDISSYNKVFFHAEESLNRKVTIKDTTLNIRQNIGYAEAHEQTGLIELVNQAAIANAYAAKEEHFVLKKYSEEMTEDLKNNVNMAKRLQTAIDENIIDINFQKIIDSRNNKVLYIEALARWNDPKIGIVSPDRFISFAINSKLIDSLDDYLVDKTLRYFAQYLKQENSDVLLNLNISSSALFRTNFLSDLNKKIKQYELKSSSIVIEISENTFVRDTEECIKRINAFKKSGFLIAIDDFGSEYSSLGILDNIPFDILKLDGVFAQRYESETMMKIATTVSQVALRQGKTIIVEQIETLEQAEIFKTMNCFIHQGYYYHKPEKLI